MEADDGKDDDDKMTRVSHHQKTLSSGLEQLSEGTHCKFGFAHLGATAIHLSTAAERWLRWTFFFCMNYPE